MTEEKDYIDLWVSFSSERSLFGRDGVHLNRVRMTRLGRVLDEKN